MTLFQDEEEEQQIDGFLIELKRIILIGTMNRLVFCPSLFRIVPGLALVNVK